MFVIILFNLLEKRSADDWLVSLILYGNHSAIVGEFAVIDWIGDHLFHSVAIHGRKAFSNEYVGYFLPRSSLAPHFESH